MRHCSPLGKPDKKRYPTAPRRWGWGGVWGEPQRSSTLRPFPITIESRNLTAGFIHTFCYRAEKGILSQAPAEALLFPHGATSSRILNSIFRDSRTRLCSSPTVEPRVPRATPVTPSSSRGRRESGVLFDLLLVSHRISLPPMMGSVGANSQTSPPDRATGIRFAQAVRFCARDRHRPDAARTVVCSARNGRFGG